MVNRKHMLRGVCGFLVIAWVALGAIFFRSPIFAQDDSSPNLLVNGSLERPYYGQGAATRTVPQGWNLWVGAGAPEAFPHTDRVQVLDGEVSWNIKQGYVAFTAAAYQTVSGLNAGDVLKMTAFGWVYTCNDTENSCIIAEAPYRRSDAAAGAALKVGIDPAGGTDPNAASVKWSATAAPYDQWAEMSVIAEAEGSSVTVFLHMTQASGLALNNVYWDNASLVRTEEGAPVAVEQFAPFVSPQGVRPDGSIVHIVQSGDTLSSIAYAYSRYSVTIESIAALNEGMKPNTRFLQLGQEIMILPPGSVDPVTGQLVPAGGQPSVSQPTAAPQVSPDTTTAPQPTDLSQEQQSAADYSIVQAAFMPFERGFMFWLQDTNQIVVLSNSESDLAGTFSVYQDTWREGMPESDPSIQPPEGLVQPDRGFGQAWRTYPGVRDSLGWATGNTHGYTALVVRDQGDIIIGGPDNRVYRMTEESGWEAIDFYLPEQELTADSG